MSDFDNCPNKANHTPAPEGYRQWHAWAEKIAKTHRQVTCESCGTYSIWLPKAEAKEEMKRRRLRDTHISRRWRKILKVETVNE